MIFLTQDDLTIVLCKSFMHCKLNMHTKKSGLCLFILLPPVHMYHVHRTYAHTKYACTVSVITIRILVVCMHMHCSHVLVKEKGPVKSCSTSTYSISVFILYQRCTIQFTKDHVYIFRNTRGLQSCQMTTRGWRQPQNGKQNTIDSVWFSDYS